MHYLRLQSEKYGQKTNFWRIRVKGGVVMLDDFLTNIRVNFGRGVPYMVNDNGLATGASWLQIVRFKLFSTQFHDDSTD